MRYYTKIWYIIFLFSTQGLTLIGVITGSWPSPGPTASGNTMRQCQSSRQQWRPILTGSFPFFLPCSYLIFTCSYLLTFNYTEVQETKIEFPDIHATYEKFLSLLHNDFDVLEAQDKATSPNSSFSSNNNNNNHANGPNPNRFDATQNSGTPTAVALPFTIPGLSGAGGGGSGMEAG
jgi:hypothetical protein